MKPAFRLWIHRPPIPSSEVPARVTANGEIVVNSSSSKAMVVQGKGEVTAAAVYVTGGVSAAAGDITPAPVTGVSPRPDAYAALTAPAYSGCNFNNYKLTGGTATLNPGVYCGGISILGGKATFEPGLYIVNGGGLSILGGSASGQGVTFYITSNGHAYGPVSIGAVQVNLSASTVGPLAGVLFFQDRWSSRTCRIRSWKTAARSSSACCTSRRRRCCTRAAAHPARGRPSSWRTLSIFRARAIYGSLRARSNRHAARPQHISDGLLHIVPALAQTVARPLRPRRPIHGQPPAFQHLLHAVDVVPSLTTIADCSPMRRMISPASAVEATVLAPSSPPRSPPAARPGWSDSRAPRRPR